MSKKPTAQVIFDAVRTSFSRRSISLSNVIGFGSDGCNTMMGDKNSVMTRFEASCPGIYVSKCVSHSLHICASEATKKFPKECEDVARDVFGFFKSSAKRRAILSKFQAYVNVEPHNMLLPSQTRWLSLHPVVSRILEQWPALLLFFTDMVHEEGLACADRILQNLTDPSIKLHFHFLNWILSKFNAINLLFFN